MLKDNVKVIENINKEKQEKIWLNTISGSQLWKLYKSDKDYKVLLLSKLGLFAPKISDFSKSSMKRGIEREPFIIERLKLEYDDYTYITKNNKTLYSEKYRMSANPDAIDDKAKVVFEIKSSSSELTKEYAVYQLSLYKLLLSLYDEKYFDYRYLLVSENPETKKIEIVEPFLFESEKIIKTIELFWNDYKYYKNKYKSKNNIINCSPDLDYNVLCLQILYDRKAEVIKQIEELENKLGGALDYGNKYYYYRIIEKKEIKYKAKPAHIQTRNINKLVIGKIDNGKKSA